MLHNQTSSRFGSFYGKFRRGQKVYYIIDNTVQEYVIESLDWWCGWPCYDLRPTNVTKTLFYRICSRNFYPNGWKQNPPWKRIGHSVGYEELFMTKREATNWLNSWN